MTSDGITRLSILDMPGDVPTITLVGEAKSLRGELHLRNSSHEKIQVGEARLRWQTTADAVSFRFGQISLPASLEAGQAQRVKLALDLDPQIPPGKYKGEMDIAGQTYAAVIYVVEMVRLTITPQSLVMDQPSGSVVTKQIVLANEGNVALTINPIEKVALGEELMQRRSTGVTVAATGEKDSRSVGKLLAELVDQEARSVLGEVVWMQVINPKLVLQPGEIHPLSLEIRLPEKLSQHTRYIGRLPLYTNALEFIVVPSVGQASSNNSVKE